MPYPVLVTTCENTCRRACTAEGVWERNPSTQSARGSSRGRELACRADFDYAHGHRTRHSVWNGSSVSTCDGSWILPTSTTVRIASGWPLVRLMRHQVPAAMNYSSRPGTVEHI